MLNVLLLLFELQFFAVVTHNICHAVHFVLDALSASGHFTITCLFFLESYAHVLLDLSGLDCLLSLGFSNQLFLGLHVVFDDLHGCLALLLFTSCLVHTLVLKLRCKLRYAIALLSLTLVKIVLLLLFDLLEHGIALGLGLEHLLLCDYFLLSLNFELFLGLVEDALVEVLTLFRCLVAKFLPEFDLLVKHFFDLLNAILLLLFLLAHLLLVQLLAELLDLAPLVLADVARQVLDQLPAILLRPVQIVVDLLGGGERLRLGLAIVGQRAHLGLPTHLLRHQ